MKIYKLSYYDRFDDFYKRKYLLGYFTSDKVAYDHFLILKTKDDSYYEKVLPSRVDRLRYIIEEITLLG